MGCHGGFALDEGTRRSWYNPELVLQDLGPGMVFADIGCGDGFFTFLAARKVGKDGKVYAVDVDAAAIQKIKDRAKTEGLKNIVTRISRAEETVFCNECADFVFYSMVLHDFDDPSKVLKNAKEMLKSNGQVVDLDWKKIEMPFGPPFQIRFTEKKASVLMQEAGFTVSNIKEVGAYHYLLIAKST